MSMGACEVIRGTSCVWAATCTGDGVGDAIEDSESSPFTIRSP